MKNIPTSLIKDKIYCVNYLIYKDEAGSTGYIYIAVRQDDMSDFKNAIKNGDFDADDYGIVLEQGGGKPSDETVQRMKILYSCDHDNSFNVLDYKY
jgi:hypothetical protein